MTTSSSPTISLPYSTFLAQVKAGNIKTADVSSSTAGGDFRKSYKEPTGGTTYTQYTSTLLPIDDPSLVGILTSHNVQITGTSSATPLWLTVLSLLLHGPALYLLDRPDLLRDAVRRAASNRGSSALARAAPSSTPRNVRPRRSPMWRAWTRPRRSCARKWISCATPPSISASAHAFPRACCWWAARHRQNADGARRCGRGAHAVLQHQRHRIRGDVRGRGRQSGARSV